MSPGAAALPDELDDDAEPGTVVDEVRPGDRVGSYRIVRRLAVGGMAELYLACAQGLAGFEKQVAIKRVRAGLADPELIAMFLDEARLAAHLQHPNIAQSYELGHDRRGYYLVMEYVDGRDLRELLQATARRQARLPLSLALAIVGGVALGLDAAHGARAPDGTPLHVVHRDVSPSNVIVTRQGGVKLIDFGIAKAARRQTVTQAGQRKGKFSYMSPEQCVGGALDRRSDVFSLGIVLYELTTMRRLFRGRDEYDSMRRIVHGPTPPPSTVCPGYPPGLEAIVMRALERDVARRYPSARALYLELTAFARRAGLHATELDLAAYLGQLDRAAPVTVGPVDGARAVTPTGRDTSRGWAPAAPVRALALDEAAVTRQDRPPAVATGTAPAPAAPVPVVPRARAGTTLALVIALTLVTLAACAAIALGLPSPR